MADLRLLEVSTLEDLMVGVARPDHFPNVTMFVFSGELHSLNADDLFRGLINPKGHWLKDLSEDHTVVLDFYELTYVNSVGVGYLAQLAQSLHKSKIDILMIIQKDNQIYPVFEYVGLFQFPGVRVQYQSYDQGLDL